MYYNGQQGMNGYNQPKIMTPEQQKTAYKKYLRQVRSQTPFNPKMLPQGELLFDGKGFLDMSKVKGIKDKYYGQLNGELVYPYKRQRISHNIYFNSGEVRERKTTQVPADCVPILSDKVLGLPPKYEAEDKRLGYLDFLDAGVNGANKLRGYIYVLPKEYLTPESRTALIVSKTERKNHYGGYKITLKNGHPVFLLVVDYKYYLLEDPKINVVFTARGQIQLNTVEEYIMYLASLGMAHTLDEWEGEFCTEVYPHKEFETNTLTLDKINLSEHELEELNAESFLEGLD